MSGPKHVFELTNRAYLQLVGDRDLIGRAVAEALPEVVDQGFVELLDHVYQTGEPFIGRDVSLDLQRGPDGRSERRYVDFVYQPLKGADGTPKGIFVEGFDVTEAKLAADALSESEGRLRLAIDAGRMAVWQHDSRSDTIAGSPELNKLLGFPPSGDLDTDEVRARFYPDDRNALLQAATGAIQHQERYFEAEFRFYRTPDDIRWLLMRAEISPRADGTALTVGVVIDITDRRETEESLWERQQELDAALEAGALAIFDFDHRTNTMRPSAKLNELYGYPADHPLTLEDIRARYHPEAAEQIMERARQENAAPDITSFAWTLRLLLPGDEERWLEGRGEHLRDGQGHFVRSRGVLMDITQRKRWDAQQQLLVNELNHRVKNTLAIVQSLAWQSLRDVDPVSKQRFEARLLALSSAHNLLTARRWESASVADIVRTAVTAAVGADARVHCEGPDVEIAPETAVAVALAVHELTTNAIKHGALSGDLGSVRVLWEVTGVGEEANFHLEWIEEGGPAVAPPTSHGFGVRMIEKGLSAQLSGKACLHFEPSGLRCVIDAPLHPLTPAGRGGWGTTSSQGGQPRPRP